MLYEIDNFTILCNAMRKKVVTMLDGNQVLKQCHLVDKLGTTTKGLLTFKPTPRDCYRSQKSRITRKLNSMFTFVP